MKSFTTVLLKAKNLTVLVFSDFLKLKLLFLFRDPCIQSILLQSHFVGYLHFRAWAYSYSSFMTSSIMNTFYYFLIYTRSIMTLRRGRNLKTSKLGVKSSNAVSFIILFVFILFKQISIVDCLLLSFSVAFNYFLYKYGKQIPTSSTHLLLYVISHHESEKLLIFGDTFVHVWSFPTVPRCPNLPRKMKRKYSKPLFKLDIVSSSLQQLLSQTSYFIKFILNCLKTFTIYIK